MVKEAGRQPSQKETGVQTSRFSRTENPLLTILSRNATSFRNFATITNEIIAAYADVNIELPQIDLEEESTTIQVPYTGFTPTMERSLKQLMSHLYQNDEIEGKAFWYIRDVRKGPSFLHPFITVDAKPAFAMGPILRHDDFPREGLFLVGPLEKKKMRLGKEEEFDQEKRPLDGTLEVHSSTLSEVEQAYETVMAALILAGKLDISTPEKLEEAKPQSTEIFMAVYHKMLEQMIPRAEREEMVGLDEQTEGIETNLYEPLTTGQGKPMNTLLIGASGLGKTLELRHFAYRKGALGIPMSVGNFEAFEHILPNLQRISQVVDRSVVLLVSDAENLFQNTISIGADGIRGGVVFDPRRRARTLNLFEAMADIHHIYLLGTLNIPIYDPALLRRFTFEYFPIPNKDQRMGMLRQVIPPIDSLNGQYDNFIDQIAERTGGFNFSGLGIIPDLLGNMVIRGMEVTDTDEFIESLVAKARQSTDIVRLANDDQAMRAMINLPPLLHVIEDLD